MFSTELGAGPLTRFPQVLGERMTSGLRNLSLGEPSVWVRTPPAGSHMGPQWVLGTKITSAQPASESFHGSYGDESVRAESASLRLAGFYLTSPRVEKIE